jgi:hypothetical protein
VDTPASGLVISTNDQRVTIGLGAQHRRRGCNASGTGTIFDDDRLTERNTQVLAGKTHRDIREPTRAEGHDDAQGTRWVSVGCAARVRRSIGVVAAARGQRGERQQSQEKLAG